jgi:ubiquinone/menaquinone biosynthesis C-methylase UbiE
MGYRNSMDEFEFSKIKGILCCPKCHGKMDVGGDQSTLICQSDQNHTYPIIDGIPSFVKREEIAPEDTKWIFEYDESAEDYDQTVTTYNEMLGVDLLNEGTKIIQEIPVQDSSRILDVSTGTGRMIFALEGLHPNLNIEFVGVDLSIGMLRVAQRKLNDAKLEVPLLHTQVNELPFEDDSFDVVTHSGGINTFGNIPAALKEWARVLKPEGFLWIADEGISPALRKTRRGAEIMNKNKLFGINPPLKHLPPQVKNISLRWWARDTFFLIACQKLSDEELKEVDPLRVWLTAEI